MITTALFLLGWIVTGVLSYGLTKNNMKQFLQSLTYVGHDKTGEAICIMFGFLGPIGITASLLLALNAERTFELGATRKARSLYETTRR